MRPHLDTIKSLAEELCSEVRNESATLPIRNEVRDVEERYNKLLDKLEEKVKAIDSFANIIKNFNMQLQDIQNELNRLESVLNNMEPIARSANALRVQLDDIRDFRNQLKNVGKQLKDADDLYRSIIVPLHQTHSAAAIAGERARLLDCLSDVQAVIDRARLADARHVLAVRR